MPNEQKTTKSHSRGGRFEFSPRERLLADRTQKKGATKKKIVKKAESPKSRHWSGRREKSIKPDKKKRRRKETTFAPRHFSYKSTK